MPLRSVIVAVFCTAIVKVSRASATRFAREAVEFDLPLFAKFFAHLYVELNVSPLAKRRLASTCLALQSVVAPILRVKLTPRFGNGRLLSERLIANYVEI